jgi:hypothetical protein
LPPRWGEPRPAVAVDIVDLQHTPGTI